MHWETPGYFPGVTQPKRAASHQVECGFIVKLGLTGITPVPGPVLWMSPSLGRRVFSDKGAALQNPVASMSFPNCPNKSDQAWGVPRRCSFFRSLVPRPCVSLTGLLLFWASVSSFGKQAGSVTTVCTVALTIPWLHMLLRQLCKERIIHPI